MEKCTIRTQFGTITGSPHDADRLVREVLGEGSIQLVSGEYRPTTLISDSMEYWKPSHFEGKGARHFRGRGNLLARHMNFQFALMRCDFNFSAAIEFAKKHLFDDDVDRSPVYIHDWLSSKAGKDYGIRNSEFCYGKVLKSFEEEFRKAPKDRNSHYEIKTQNYPQNINPRKDHQ